MSDRRGTTNNVTASDPISFSFNATASNIILLPNPGYLSTLEIIREHRIIHCAYLRLHAKSVVLYVRKFENDLEL